MQWQVVAVTVALFFGFSHAKYIREKREVASFESTPQCTRWTFKNSASVNPSINVTGMSPIKDMYLTYWLHLLKHWQIPDDYFVAAKAIGAKSFMISEQWSDIEIERGNIDITRLYKAVNHICGTKGLRVMILIDFHATPNWALGAFSDGPIMDSTGRVYSSVSVYHPSVNEHLMRVWRRILYLLLLLHSCISGVSANFNNEYETKYTQEYYSVQDYTPAALRQYASYLEERNMDLQYWNKRWETSYVDWNSIKPASPVHSGPHFRLEYWDFQAFREEKFVNVVESFARVAVSMKYVNFAHFGEFFTHHDYIYVNVFFKLVKSPLFTQFMLDSNFLELTTLALPGVSKTLSAVTYLYPDKVFYFEGAVERLNFNRQEDISLFRDGMLLSLDCGVDALGIVNLRPEWLHVAPQILFSRAATPPQPPTLYEPEGTTLLTNKRKPTVLVYAPYYAFYLYYGKAQWPTYDHDVDGLKRLLMSTLCEYAGIYEPILVVGDDSLISEELMNQFETLVFFQVGVLGQRDHRNLQSLMHKRKWHIVGVTEDRVRVLDLLDH